MTSVNNIVQLIGKTLCVQDSWYGTYKHARITDINIGTHIVAIKGTDNMSRVFDHEEFDELINNKELHRNTRCDIVTLNEHFQII